MFTLYKRYSRFNKNKSLNVIAYASEAETDNTSVGESRDIASPNQMAELGFTPSASDSAAYAAMKEGEYKTVAYQDSITTAHEDAAIGVSQEINDQAMKGTLAGPLGFAVGTITGTYDGVKNNCANCHGQ